ncbi:hypothetical protein AXG93_3825s1240 [Marchantia polymorpha subsp. ruderalis]|uniref:Spc7 kinetochore protein domain-containing protein n=1 Tax=Marchantia polymorpha subsp. ruderalis TaxID=1480154 RepID=A0A176W8C1_MARPO|nr:hypothetical protein AXG93_3825s1240 [Marchantia polymorpha subsp. ruderalis]
METPPFEQKSYDETTTVFGIDEDGSVVKRRRKRRSLGRRVSFAEAPAYHIFTRDDEYVSPSHDAQDAQGSAPQHVPKRRSPRLASKMPAAGGDDKENRRPVLLNEVEDCKGRRSTKPLSNLEQTTGSPASRPPSWHPAKNTSSLSRDDGEICDFVDIQNCALQQKNNVFDEDVTLDSTTFTFKLSQLQALKSQADGDQDKLFEPAPSTKRSYGRKTRGESPGPGSGENDTSMSFTMIQPIIRQKLGNLHSGHVDGSTDMSITMQVSRKHSSFLGTDVSKQDEVIEIMKAYLSEDNGERSPVGAPLSDLNLPKSRKTLPTTKDTQVKVDKDSRVDKEIVVLTTASGTGGTESNVTKETYAEFQKESVTLAAIIEEGGSGNLIAPVIPAGSGRVIPTETASRHEETENIFLNPAVSVEYEKDDRGPRGPNREIEATLTMDGSVSGTYVLEPGGHRGSARRSDQSKNSTTTDNQEPSQHNGNAQNLQFAILSHEETLLVPGNEERGLIATGSEEHGKENTDPTSREKKILAFTEETAKSLLTRGDDASTATTPANTTDATVTNTTDFRGQNDRLFAADLSEGLERVNRGLSATCQREEATVTMDMSISPTSTSLPHVECKRPALELERSITLDIPSLQDLVQEEEDEDMVTDMKMDTEIVCSRPTVTSNHCNSATRENQVVPGFGRRKIQGEEVFLMDNSLNRPTCMRERVSEMSRDELDHDRSITLGIPKKNDIIREEEDYTHIEGQKKAPSNVVFPSLLHEVRNVPSSSDGDFSGSITAQVPRCSDLLAADSVSPDRAPAWNKSRRSSWVAPLPSSLRSSELGHAEGGGNICVTPCSDSGMEIVDDCGEPTLYSREVASLQASRGVQVVNIEASSAQVLGKGGEMHINLQNLTPTGDSGESMDIVGDTTDPMLLSSTVRLAELSHQSENTTLADCDEQMVIVDSTRPPVPSGIAQILKVSERPRDRNSDRSEQTTDIVPEAADTAPHFGPVKRAKFSMDVENRTSTDGSEDNMSMVEDLPKLNSTVELSSKRIGSISRFGEPQQILAPALYLSPVKQSHSEAKVPNYQNYTPSPSPRTYDAKELINSVLQSSARLASVGTVDKTFTFTCQTTEVQQHSLRKLQERLTLQLHSAKKLQLSAGNQSSDCTPTIRYKGAEQACSLADQSDCQHGKDGDTISVDDFFKLTEVNFCAKRESSGCASKDKFSIQAYQVNTIDAALKHFFLVQPRIGHMMEACSLVQDDLEKIRTKEARLEDELTASNPSLFSRFQKVGPGEKQQIKGRIHRLQTKCRLVEKRHWLNFRLGLEKDWNVKLLQSKSELQLHVEELRNGNSFLEENYQQILHLQARIPTNEFEVEEYPSDKTAPKAVEEKARNKCALDKIKYLKEQLVDVNSSAKTKLEKLLNRTKVTEEALRTSKERLAFSQCRLHDLQTKLAEHVRMGHSPAAGLQIAARPEFYVKEMSNKVSLLKALQGGWQVAVVGQDIVELSYTRKYLLDTVGLVKRRLVVAKTAGTSHVIESTWDVDFAGVELATRFLVSNLLVLMEEIGECQKVTKAFARGVLVVPRFLLNDDEQMQLEIKFMDCLLSVNFILTLGMTYAQRDGYPFGAMPAKVDMVMCPRSLSHKLNSAALEGAIVGVEPGFHRVKRICAAMGSFLATLRDIRVD